MRLHDDTGRWDDEHYAYQCFDGPHNSFWKTVTESPEWKAWEREIGLRLMRTNPRGPVFDVDECRECGWLSPEHFYAFVKFCRTRKAIDARRARK